MKSLTPRELELFFSSLEQEYDVRLPVRLPDGTRCWGRPDEGSMALEGGSVPRRPTEIFFPQHDPVFTARGEKVKSPSPPSKPILLAGLPAADLEALAFVDAFFAAGIRDDLYFSRRQGATIVGVSGKCGRDGEVLPRGGKHCDLELVADGGRWFVVSHTEAGERLSQGMPAGEEFPEPELPSSPDGELEMLQRASALLLSEKVPDAFWQKIADRCIACTGCTLVCPTCTCFALQDRRWPDQVERSRLWDSCQLDGYAREASGHNPLGTEALRTRRRIHHKLAADVRRWGRISCVACGRCENVCPSAIGLLSVAREMVAKYG